MQLPFKGQNDQRSSRLYRQRFLAVLTTAACLLLVSGCAENGNGESVTGSPVSLATSSSTPGPSKTPELPAVNPDVQPSKTPTPASSDDSISANERIQQKVAAMPLETKIGQMLLVGVDGTKIDSQTQTMIADDQIGGIILYKDNISNLKDMVSLINDLKKSNRGNPAPLFMSVDQEGGKVSRMPEEYALFPSNAAVGATQSAAAAETMGKLLAREVRSAGFNMNFAPVLDINSNPDNPVIGDRSFGDTESIVSSLGIAEMNGISSEGVIPVVKHFPGHGDTAVDSHLELPVVNKTAAQLAGLEWLPFQAAIEEQADVVMVAHILYPELDPGQPASLSKAIIGKLLREDMGFQGVVITDDLTMGAITEHYSLETAAVDTVLAGSDILLVAHGYKNEVAVKEALLESVRNGTIPESRIDESVGRILALKEKYQLKDSPLAVPKLTELNRDIKAWRQSLSK